MSVTESDFDKTWMDWPKRALKLKTRWSIWYLWNLPTYDRWKMNVYFTYFLMERDFKGVEMLILSSTLSHILLAKTTESTGIKPKMCSWIYWILINCKCILFSLSSNARLFPLWSLYKYKEHFLLNLTHPSKWEQWATTVQCPGTNPRSTAYCLSPGQWQVTRPPRGNPCRKGENMQRVRAGMGFEVCIIVLRVNICQPLCTHLLSHPQAPLVRGFQWAV